ncbi:MULTISPECIES: ABC transporter ATP-binding protein [Enterococcaceae]|uniref:ABC transporter ATP-binding protein n=1 Tax=Enterococcaceae TaxID=81852 RepID=UPI000E548DE8|nr:MULTISPECIES: ABC transporter ATP-binding protein [Enterococcaceae]MCI0131380.1 ABC transporter ATP-binding protein [Vagococcus sp. CY53-2]RGI29066.1 ABC transporter ATP-binding protein [Melissococcus sp. OM08-11BH]UNM89567.1 ABC transporter ATP-binding protein [Vagococcus sp. CY52-2]
MNEENYVIEMRNITKQFGDFKANDNINLQIRKGEIHALLGENGAGKSTLMNVLSGLLQPTSGQIYMDGQPVTIANPTDAKRLGIGMVHQHFMLVDAFTVTENIILGDEPTKSGVLDKKKSVEDLKRISEQYGMEVNPDALISDISVGMQQRVEILKTLYRGANILIFDEPTAVLTPQEIDELIMTMKELVKEGKSIIIITHKLDEIKKVADRCTVIRRGKSIETVNVKDVSSQQLADLMVGRSVSFKTEKEPSNPKEVILSVKDLHVKDNRGLEAIKGLDLDVRAGEVVGIAGIDGNGQTELIQAITGLKKIESGKVMLRDKDITNLKPRQITESSVGHVPEDRHKYGLVLDMTLSENIALQTYYHEPFSKNGVLNYNYMDSYARKLIEEYDVRTTSEHAQAKSLSGGNQQKAIIAREMDRDPELLIVSQPTRGLDVGAIEYIHKRLINHRDKGNAVLVVSFELEEILNVSDRIAVIHAGQIVGIVDPKETTENELGLLMAGYTLEEARRELGTEVGVTNE